MFRLIVAGSRSFVDYSRMAADLDMLLSRRAPDVEIICGGCPNGADALAIRYAQSRGFALRIMPAQWGAFGRSAGPLRNRAMAQMGNGCVAYWDGKSRGTADMIKAAQAIGLRVVVRRF